MKAGALTPATPPEAGNPWRLLRALNEGGGSHPRNASDRPPRRDHEERSMKAGALTPATRRVDSVSDANVARSMKAGALTPATPSVPVGSTVW